MDDGPFFITQVTFTCCGCGTEWMVQIERPLRNAQDIIHFVKSYPNQCPRSCGSYRCNAAFNLGVKK